MTTALTTPPASITPLTSRFFDEGFMANDRRRVMLQVSNAGIGKSGFLAHE